MADITMCRTDDCPLAENCYRKQAEPSIWQSVAVFDFTTKHGVTTCDSFINARLRRTKSD